MRTAIFTFLEWASTAAFGVRELMNAGKDVAYDEIMDAVSDFDMVNAKLAEILTKLSAQDEE